MSCSISSLMTGWAGSDGDSFWRSDVDLKVIMGFLLWIGHKKAHRAICRAGWVKWVMDQARCYALWGIKQLEAVEISSYLRGIFNFTPAEKGAEIGGLPLGPTSRAGVG